MALAYSKSPGLCSLNIIKSPIQFVYAGVETFFILNAFHCAFVAYCFQVSKTQIILKLNVFEYRKKITSCFDGLNIPSYLAYSTFLVVCKSLNEEYNLREI